MHILLHGTNGNNYVVRDNDIRRVLDKGKRECTVYFNNKADTPITVGIPINKFLEQYLGGAFILLTDKFKNLYLVRHKSIRRVHSDMAGNTTVCFSTTKDSAIAIDMSVDDFNVIYLEKK